MNNSAAQKSRRIIEDFIRKATLVILNSRISNNKSKPNSTFLLTENDNDDLDDIFLEDYQELLSHKNQMNTYTIEIYFKRQDFKVMIEKWSMQYFHQAYSDEILNEDYYNKKLIVMLRSVYSMSRYTPAYSLFNTKDKEYDLEYRLYFNMKNQSMFSIGKRNYKISETKIGNNNLANISITNEYITKEDVFQLEKDFNRNKIEELICQRNNQRQRCLSQTNPLIDPLPLFEVITFDGIFKETPYANYNAKAKTITVNDAYYSHKRKPNVNIKLNMSEIDQDSKPSDNISFQSSNDYYHNPYTEPNHQPSSGYNIDFSSIKQSVLIFNTIGEFNELKKQAFNNNDTGESSLKKIMTTLDTSSSNESNTSFRLNYEDDRPSSRSKDNNDSSSACMVNKSIDILIPETEIILANFKNLKKRLKKKTTKVNCYKLSEIYMIILRSKY